MQWVVVCWSIPDGIGLLASELSSVVFYVNSLLQHPFLTPGLSEPSCLDNSETGPVAAPAMKEVTVIRRYLHIHITLFCSVFQSKHFLIERGHFPQYLSISLYICLLFQGN